MLKIAKKKTVLGNFEQFEVQTNNTAFIKLSEQKNVSK